MILVEDITEELKADYLELIRDGLDPGSAAKQLGTTGSQFRKLRRAQSRHFDPVFADEVAIALESDTRHAGRRERLDEAVWTAVDRGEKWAIEKCLYAYHPDFEHLRHTNLRVSGEIMIAAQRLLPHLSDDELRARLAEIEAREAMERPALAALPAPKVA